MRARASLPDPIHDSDILQGRSTRASLVGASFRPLGHRIITELEDDLGAPVLLAALSQPGQCRKLLDLPPLAR